MSSQSSEEDCPVTYRPLDKNIFKDTYPYMWYTVEEDEDEPVPPRFKNESIEVLCRRIIKLEMENDELRIDNFILRRKLEEKKDKPSTSSPPPPPSSSPKENRVSGMSTPLGLCQAWGRCPDIVSPPLSFAFTYISLIHSYLLL